MSSYEQTSLRASIINLVKNLLGAGMLSLPLAIAICGDFRVGLALIVLCGIMNASTFILVGSCCRMTGERTYRGLFTSVFGQRRVWMIDLTIMLNSTFACLALMILVGDFTSRCISGLLGYDVPRAVGIFVFGFGFILPLCLFDNLKSLRVTSGLGILATLYTFLFVLSQALYRDSYIVTTERSYGVLKSWALFCTSFMAHYNAPRFYTELHNPTLKRFTLLVLLSFSLVAVIYVFFAWAGFAVFGSSVKGDVLESFESSSAYLQLAWISMALSLTFTYPFVFTALKDSFAQLVPHANLKVFIFSAISASIIIASCIDDVSGFNAIKGATSACILSFIIPPAMYLRAVTDSRPLIDGNSSCIASMFIARLILLIGCPLGIASVLYLIVSNT